MAFTVGDEVAIKRVIAAQSLASSGNFMFGLANAEDGDLEVLWENGEITLDIPPTILDKIVGVNAPEAAVSFSDGSGGANSPEYQGTIVRRYTREPEAEGGGTSFTLIRLFGNGELVEVPTSAVSVIAGR